MPKKYAKNMQNMQKIIKDMQKRKAKYAKYANICKNVPKICSFVRVYFLHIYANLKVCTGDFADGHVTVPAAALPQ